MISSQAKLLYEAYSPNVMEQEFSEVCIAPVHTIPAWATAIRREDGVALDAYSYVLPSMQERDVNAITEMFTNTHK